MNTNTSYRDLMLKLMVKVTPEQDAACRYLESRGLVFLVDYGIWNAEEKAAVMLALDHPLGLPS